MKDEKVEVSRLISLLKKPFPPIDENFYQNLRKKLDNIDKKLERTDLEEERKELEKEKKNLKRYGERIYSKRVRALLVELSKKFTGGRANIGEFTEEEVELFNAIYELIEEKKKELIEGEVDILQEKEISFDKLEEESKQDEKSEISENYPPSRAPKSQNMEAKDIEIKEREEHTSPEEEKRKHEKVVTIPLRMLSNKPFVGLDGHCYYPEKGDVLNLHEKVARILLDGGYAERIESR